MSQHRDTESATENCINCEVVVTHVRQLQSRRVSKGARLYSQCSKRAARTVVFSSTHYAIHVHASPAAPSIHPLIPRHHYSFTLI